MARRKKIDLKDIEVVIKMPVPSAGQNKEASVSAALEGQLIPRSFHKTIRLHGHLDERAQQILRNSARFCPVQQFYSGGPLRITDEIEVIEA